MSAEALRSAQLSCRDEQHKLTICIQHNKQPTDDVRDKMMGLINHCQIVAKDFGLNIDGKKIVKFRKEFKKALEHPGAKTNTSALLYSKLEKILETFYVAFTTEQLRLAAAAAAAAAAVRRAGGH